MALRNVIAHVLLHPYISYNASTQKVQIVDRLSPE